LAVAPEPLTVAGNRAGEDVEQARALVFGDEGDLYRFRLIARDGSAILTSRGYADRKGARNGLKAMLRNAADESRYRRHQRADGNHYFEVKAANGRNLWTSADYEDIDRMNADLHRLIETAWRTASR
ncbi:MAG: YegP family protein, partial [Pseudomonadota bacterium]